MSEQNPQTNCLDDAILKLAQNLSPRFIKFGSDESTGHLYEVVFSILSEKMKKGQPMDEVQVEFESKCNQINDQYGLSESRLGRIFVWAKLIHEVEDRRPKSALLSAQRA